MAAYDFDCLNRIIRISGSGGEKKEYAYDAVGNVTAMTDAYGNVTRYAYFLTGQFNNLLYVLPLAEHWLPQLQLWFWKTDKT